MIDHLDDDALSAVLDGEAIAPDVAHAEACTDCGARLDALRAAAAAVAAPVPPAPPGAVDAAVARALGASRTAARPRWTAPVLAAAAVVVALGVAVPLLARDRGHDKATTAAAPARREAAGTTATGVEALDPATLRAAVEDRLSAKSALAAPAPQADVAAGESATEDCEARLRAGSRSLPPLVLQLPARWEGAPAVVLAFRAGDGPVTVYVTAQPDCRILHFERFRASP